MKGDAFKGLLPVVYMSSTKGVEESSFTVKAVVGKKQKQFLFRYDEYAQSFRTDGGHCQFGVVREGDFVPYTQQEVISLQYSVPSHLGIAHTSHV